MSNIFDIFAAVMTTLGDLFIFITFASALMVFFFNIMNARSETKRQVPTHFLVLGWITFAISYVGLVAISRTKTYGYDVGEIVPMSLVIAILILYFAFSLLLLGTAWTLRSRRNLKEELKAQQTEALQQSAAA